MHSLPCERRRTFRNGSERTRRYAACRQEEYSDGRGRRDRKSPCWNVLLHGSSRAKALRSLPARDMQREKDQEGKPIWSVHRKCAPDKDGDRRRSHDFEHRERGNATEHVGPIATADPMTAELRGDVDQCQIRTDMRWSAGGHITVFALAPALWRRLAGRSLILLACGRDAAPELPISRDGGGIALALRSLRYLSTQPSQASAVATWTPPYAAWTRRPDATGCRVSSQANRAAILRVNRRLIDCGCRCQGGSRLHHRPGARRSIRMRTGSTAERRRSRTLACVNAGPAIV